MKKASTITALLLLFIISSCSVSRYIKNVMDNQVALIKQEIPGVEVKQKGNNINLTFDESNGIYFATGEYDINSTSKTTLKKLSKIFKKFPYSDILVEGHTDNNGNENSNMNLSEKRAKSVKNYLTSQGIASERFSTKWYGETEPKHKNDTEEGKAKNRRVELVITPNDALMEEAKKQVSKK